MSLKELEQDPFDAEEFVERLAWKTIGESRSNVDTFDPVMLHQNFERTIRHLKEMKKNVVQRVNNLENECEEEEKAHWQKVAQLHKHVQTAFGHFKDLDERINFVATKVVHLGDQLEGVNQPRMRALEASTLMKYFSEFLDSPTPSHFFKDPFQVEAAADVIQKLHLIVQELPSNEKFKEASLRVHGAYTDIERRLLDDFKKAHFEGDVDKMRSLANTLSNFKGYSKCIDIFIEESQKGTLNKATLFQDIPGLCEKLDKVIREVFAYPEAVIDKLVVNIFQGRLQDQIDNELTRSDLEKYLQNLYNLHEKTAMMCVTLQKVGVGGGSVVLDKLMKSVFNSYLDKYINDEKAFLKSKCESILAKFYESKNHQKKQIQTGGIHDLRRDIQAVIGNKTSLNLGPAIENYGSETFLSQDVVISIMQEFKLALKRCQSLSQRNELANNAAKIFELLVQYLCLDYIDYAVELGLQAIPVPDPKVEPKYYFINIVHQANSDFHLIEKLFNENIQGLVAGTSRNGECLQRKREVFEMMENKMDSGLDRTLTSMAGWCKHILSTEQKKSDFKPDADEGPLQMFSGACGKVVGYLKYWINVINNGLDGKNVENVLTEFAIRLHRVLFEHLQQYQYNSIGAMMVICDVNEYRKCMKELGIPLVNDLFNVLHALCNLLVVVPENLKQVCSGEELASMEKSTLISFIQLRSDYKTAKLALHFK